MHIITDYLVIGAGAAPLAFIDTLLQEMPAKKVILVDKKSAPGGHWNDDYDFVKLHQPSIVYGLSSKALEGSWMKLILMKAMLPWKHRASKAELLTYFGDFVDSKVVSGQIQYFPECVYDFDQEIGNGTDSITTTFTSLDGKIKHTVEIRDKLINGVNGECIIPSLSPPTFPVDERINLVTPNDLYMMKMEKQKNLKKKRHFIVLGCGKTAMDSVVFMQTKLKIKPDDISWIIPNDVWMLAREGSTPFQYTRALLEADGDQAKASLAMEARGEFVRLDPNITPTRFRFPVIGKDELELMRNIKNIIRRGRISSIVSRDGDGVMISFESDQEDWIITTPEKENIFIHCTSPGPFNGKNGEFLNSDHEMRLQLLFAPPISISMSCLAKLESARNLDTLDVEFGRELLNKNDASPDEILHQLINGLSDKSDIDILDKLRSTINLGVFIALLDPDPMVGYNWLKSNRLSMYSIPGFKGHITEDLYMIVEKGKIFGSPPDQLEMIHKIAKKLEPLRGK